MTTYKWNDGTAGGFAHVLTVADDGRRNIEIRVNGRALRYDDVEERPCEYCRGTRLHYGKGSSLPWTNAKGERWPQWEPLTETETTAEQGATGTTATAAPEPQEEQHTSELVPDLSATPSTTPRQRRKRKRTATESGQGRPIAQPTTETGTAATETAQTKHNVGEWARQMFRRPIVRELAKGAGSLTALFVIWQTGLLIPFALLGGIAAGVVK